MGATVVTGSGSGAATFSGASVYNSGNQSITQNTYTAVTYDSEVYDVGGYHSTSSNTSRLTVPTTGYYHIKAAVGMGLHNANRYLKIRKNGTTDLCGDVTQGSSITATNLLRDSCTVHLVAGDYVEVYVYQASTGAVDVIGAAVQTFDIHYVGA